MKILTKEQLKMFIFPKSSQQISTGQKIVAGIKKNIAQAIILSTGINETTKNSFVDIRLWAMSNNTEKFVPTPKGIRLNMDQYAAFCTMLQDEFPAIIDEGINIISMDSLLKQEEINNQPQHEKENQ